VQEVLLLRNELLYERFIGSQRNRMIARLIAQQQEQENLSGEISYWVFSIVSPMLIALETSNKTPSCTCEIIG